MLEDSKIEGFRGKMVAIDGFIKGIRLIQSSHPEALPLRSQYSFDDPYRSEREKNRSQYNLLKDKLIDEKLFINEQDQEGIYFFIEKKDGHVNYYYIGISGTRAHQKNALRERLRKHLLTFDYIFYSIAYPESNDTYLKECLACYGSGKYKKYANTYKHQFHALTESGITHILWISSSLLDYTLWDHVETYFVSKYKPGANQKKLNKKPPNEHVRIYNQVESTALRIINNT